MERYRATEGPLTWQVGEITVTKASVGPMDNNAYLLVPPGGEALLIDAAADGPALLGLLGGRRLGTVITTHRHHDHVQALKYVVGRTHPRCFAGRPDAAAIAQATGVACQPLWDGDRAPCDGLWPEVIGLVGHTPGSIALVLDPGDGSPVHIFTGDSLFPGGVGKTNSPADFRSLLDDVTTKLFGRFGDETVIHPGHGDASTLGAERPHLDEWRARGW